MVLRLVTCLAVVSGVAHAEVRDFTPEVKATYAVVACGGGGGAGDYAKAAVDKHCAAAGATLAAWAKNWRAKIEPFVAQHVAPAAAGVQEVLYPFGGGDLATAMVVYPDAVEYTSMSLEGMGDPRAITELAGDANGKKLAVALSGFRENLAESFGYSWNTTADLSVGSTAGVVKGGGVHVPQILGVALTALAANGYAPVSAKYFRVADDGKLVYLTTEEVAAWDAEQHRAKKKGENELQTGLFNDVEIEFKKADGTGPTKVFRHFAADLSNRGMPAGVRAWLKASTRPLGAITKAAVYLLWRDQFTDLRDVLLARMQVMVSDDTGILPAASEAAGFDVKVWGKYHGAFFPGANKATAAVLAQYWKKHSLGDIDFHFGYYDDQRKSHIMVTSRPKK